MKKRLTMRLGMVKKWFEMVREWFEVVKQTLWLKVNCLRNLLVQRKLCSGHKSFDKSLQADLGQRLI